MKLYIKILLGTVCLIFLVSPLRGDNISAPPFDPTKVKKSGDIMTGALTTPSLTIQDGASEPIYFGATTYKQKIAGVNDAYQFYILPNADDITGYFEFSNANFRWVYSGNNMFRIDTVGKYTFPAGANKPCDSATLGNAVTVTSIPNTLVTANSIIVGNVVYAPGPSYSALGGIQITLTAGEGFNLYTDSATPNPSNMQYRYCVYN